MFRFTRSMLNIIHEKQCKTIGVDFMEYFKPTFEGRSMPHKWNRRYYWSKEIKNKFRDWLIGFIIQCRPCIDRKMAIKIADFWILDNGWRIKQ